MKIVKKEDAEERIAKQGPEGRVPIALEKDLSQRSRVGALPLLIAASALHVGLVLSMLVLGRTAIFPNLIDQYGVLGPVTSDSHSYQIEAAALAGTLTDAGPTAWAAVPAQIHVKLVSLLFAILGPVFGPTILSAEPLNLVAYLTILTLVFKLGAEVGNRRVGLIAACTVALWPSFVVHTTQLLKDPLYIAAILAITFIASTWLTWTYHRRAALASGVSGGVIIGALTLIRSGSGSVVLAVVLLGITLLTIRQFRERRLLGWNWLSAFLIFVFMAAFLSPGVVRFRGLKPARASQNAVGAPDNQQTLATQDGGQIPSSLETTAEQRDTLLPRLRARADLNAARVGRLRRGFTQGYFGAGSIIDENVEFNNSFDLIHYLPKAMAVGFFSPFPHMWFVSGRSIGVAGRLISGGETLVMYGIEVLALIGLWRARSRLSAWLFLLVATFGVTILGLVVANVGTLYRMRYVFWILLIILGAKGLNDLMTRHDDGIQYPTNE